jgi:hypothetical protein
VEVHVCGGARVWRCTCRPTTSAACCCPPRPRLPPNPALRCNGPTTQPPPTAPNRPAAALPILPQSLPSAPLREAAEALWRGCCEGLTAEGLADLLRVVAAGGKGAGQDAEGLYESDEEEEEEEESEEVEEDEEEDAEEESEQEEVRQEGPSGGWTLSGPVRSPSAPLLVLCSWSSVKRARHK